jgi:hypothetical protein
MQPGPESLVRHYGDALLIGPQLHWAAVVMASCRPQGLAVIRAGQFDGLPDTAEPVEEI